MISLIKTFARILFLSVTSLFVSVLHAQQVRNVKARQEDKKIIITYDLSGGDASQIYNVKLLVSEDGGYTWKGPLQAVTGDAGYGITGGYSKQLTWDVLNEPRFDRLQGDRIAFKIRAEYYTPSRVPTTGRSAGKPCQSITTLTDPRDGKVYPTVQIGTQCWLQKNMNYQTGNSWCYGNNSSNCDTYGRLYDWKTALQVCPSGWHLPSEDEWTMLTTYLGGESVAGGKMKEAGPARWASPNTGAANSSGFTALPGGYRHSNGSFFNLANCAYFWSSQGDASNACYRTLFYLYEDVYRNNSFKAAGFSVRCLQD